MAKLLIWVLILEGIMLNVIGQAWVAVYSGYFSGWGSYMFAPKGYLACGMAVTDDPYNSSSSYDNTSLNTLKMYWCRMKDWTLQSSTIIIQGNYGSWQPDVMCPTGYFVSGMRAKVLPRLDSAGDDMDITGLEIKCKNPYTGMTSSQFADYSPVGTWRTITEDSTRYIFGTQGRYDSTTKGGKNDSRGLTGIMIHFSSFCAPTVANCEYCTATDTCTECSPGYFLLSSGSSRSCLNPCPSGFRGDNTSVPNRCVACGVTNCDTCPTSSTCTVCKSNLLVDTSTTPNKCVSTCPSGYIADLVAKLCLICGVANCAACPTISSCTACKLNFFFDTSTGSTQCVSTCPSGYRGDSVTKSCVICGITNCANCPTSLSCTACSSNFFLDYSTGSTLCVSICATGYRGDSMTKSCVVCEIANCSTCPTSSSCTACSVNFLLDNSTGSTLCVSTCPTGYRGDTVTKFCVICEIANCASCPTNSSCIECSSNFFLDNSTGSTQCVNTCPSGYRGDSATKSCVVCEIADCATCPTNTSCTECNLNFYLDSFTGSTLCVSTCPSGYRGDSISTPNICIACEIADCATCPTSSSCTDCKQNFFLDNSTGTTLCVSTCPSGYRGDSISTPNICVACGISGCAICPTDLDCTECNSNFFLDYSTGSTQCVVCPVGYRGDSATKSCIACGVQNCGICPTDSTCKDCKSSYFLHTIGGITTCEKPCPSGYLGDSSITPNICRQCSVLNCSSCNSFETCDGCDSDYYLHVKDDNYTCENFCPVGFAIDHDSSPKSCVECHIPDCEMCPTLTTCIGCKSGYYLLSLIEAISCEKTCPEGYEPSNNLGTCDPCEGEECAKCPQAYAMISEDPLICKQCNLGYKIGSSGLCDSCEDKYFNINPNGLLCKPNIPYCLEYDVSNELLQCSLCEQGYKLDSNYNCSLCEVGYIRLTQNDSVCVRSIRNCIEYEIHENDWVCSSCEIGYDLDDQKKCNKCAQGYIYANYSLLECIPETETTEDDNTTIVSEEDEDTISEIQKQRAKQIESYNSAAAVIASGSTSAASLLSLDINTIIDYINSIKIISLIQFHDIDLPFEVQKQQQSTDKFMQNLNIFLYMKIQDKELDEYIRYTLDDEYSFIANTIYNWMILGCLLGLNLITYCLSRYGRGKLKNIVNKAFHYFKSTVYIQLFMMSYLDLSHYAILKLMHVIYI